jgi:dipeptide transport system permease protein
VTLYSTPVFLIGLGLILLLSVQWGLTPVSGRLGVAFTVEPVTGFLLLDTLLGGDGRAFWSAVRHLVLPVLTLATVPFAVLQRMTRHAMIGELGEEYVRVARAKGASLPRAVSHAWRAALVPVIAVGAVTINQMVGGAILTEYVFAWPGLGQWLVEATLRRDYAVLQAALLFVGVLIIAIGVAADALQRRADPRLGRHR